MISGLTDSDIPVSDPLFKVSECFHFNPFFSFSFSFISQIVKLVNCCAAAVVCNSVSTILISSSSLTAFKAVLKTYPFRQLCEQWRVQHFWSCSLTVLYSYETIMMTMTMTMITTMMTTTMTEYSNSTTDFMLATLAFQSRAMGQPDYLAVELHSYKPQRCLRSLSQELLTVPNCKTVRQPSFFSGCISCLQQSAFGFENWL